MSEDAKRVMSWFLRGAAVVLSLVLAGACYVVYATVWGTPFRFNDLLNRQAIFETLNSPQSLTRGGFVDGTWYDFTSGKLDPYSLAERQKRFDRTRKFDTEISAWNGNTLTHQERLSYAVVRWDYARRVADEKYPWLGANNALYPVNQTFGIQQSLPNFLLFTHQITNAKLARRYVQRLRALGPVIDAVRADIARQAAAGVIAPDFIIDDTIAQMKAMIAPIPGEHPLVAHLADKTEAIGMNGAERDALINKAIAAMLDAVYPAYRRMIAEEEHLRARATHDAGLWRLQGGAAYYADQLKTMTSTNMTPDEIHAYGLSEVTRITAEMDIVLKSVGLTSGSVGERMDRLMADPRFLYPKNDAGRAQMLVHYGQILGRAKMLLPKYFSHGPNIALVVRRVPTFAQQGAPGAYYKSPSLDGKRPGIFFANLRDVSNVPMWAMPTLAYREGAPGHHMQITTAMERQGLPLQRRIGAAPAYDKGWALYAEHLAKDMGLYDNDPYGDLGRLQAELLRAVGLVVDTGIHAKRWSREQAITYMQTTTGLAASDVTDDVDIYVVQPGQACAYTIGMTTIMDLRQQAERELGPRFDIRAFHAVILENGAMPLWLLQKNVDRWMAQKEGLSANTGGGR